MPDNPIRDTVAIPLTADGRPLITFAGDQHGIIIGGYVPAGTAHWPEGWAVVVTALPMWRGCIDDDGRLDPAGEPPVIRADDIVAVTPCETLDGVPDEIAAAALADVLSEVARDLDAYRRARARGLH